jgi:hypothetical protein
MVLVVEVVVVLALLQQIQDLAVIPMLDQEVLLLEIMAVQLQQTMAAVAAVVGHQLVVHLVLLAALVL